uniref:5'-methylthioadenosine/S-adenosylhomocysteine nucleosidase n=2 Tax=Neobacillus citreus TaxID=2833578 RepID=A0A942TBD5_9BACI
MPIMIAKKIIPAALIVLSFFLMFKIEVHAKSAQRPIVIQGAMPVEVDKLIQGLKKVKKEKYGSFVFYKGEINRYPVIVSKTGKGMENAAAATAIAIVKYHPIAIINQGTSGGHVPNIHVFDIVVGKRVTNIGSFKTEIRGKNQGITPTRWMPMDLTASEESEEEVKAGQIRYFEGDQALLADAMKITDQYHKGKVVEGTIGSADVWNNEVDRINWLNSLFSTFVEEMEAASSAQVAESFQVPFLGIRIVSNNIVNGEKYNPNTETAGQSYVYKLVKTYIYNLTKK